MVTGTPITEELHQEDAALLPVPTTAAATWPPQVQPACFLMEEPLPREGPTGYTALTLGPAPPSAVPISASTVPSEKAVSMTRQPWCRTPLLLLSAATQRKFPQTAIGRALEIMSSVKVRTALREQPQPEASTVHALHSV